MSLNSTLIVIALMIVAILATVAGYYLLLLRRMRRHQQQRLAEQNRENQLQRERLEKSISMLARAMLNEQLTLTEGAIRIRMILDSLGVSDDVRSQYKAFFLLAEATQHIPILDAWKQLDSEQQLNFDRQRLQLEQDHREFVLDAAQRILDHRF